MKAKKKTKRTAMEAITIKWNRRAIKSGFTRESWDANDYGYRLGGVGWQNELCHYWRKVCFKLGFPRLEPGKSVRVKISVKVVR